MAGSAPPPFTVSWLSLALVLLALCWGALPAVWRGLTWLGWAVQFFAVGAFWEIVDRLRR